MTEQAEQLSKYQRYNRTSKGQARNARYEQRHPHRRLRWSRITGRDVAAGQIAPMPEVWPEGEQP